MCGMGPGYRIATLDDLPALTEVMTTAFIADPAWGPYSFPDDALREQQSYAFWEQGLRAALRFPWTLVTPGCEAAADIGEVKTEPPGMVLIQTGFGGRRVMDQLVGDPLPRIC